jgi:hypothetical protein
LQFKRKSVNNCDELNEITRRVPREGRRGIEAKMGPVKKKKEITDLFSVKVLTRRCEEDNTKFSGVFLLSFLRLNFR